MGFSEYWWCCSILFCKTIRDQSKRICSWVVVSSDFTSDWRGPTVHWIAAATIVFLVKLLYIFSVHIIRLYCLYLWFSCKMDHQNCSISWSKSYPNPASTSTSRAGNWLAIEDASTSDTGGHRSQPGLKLCSCMVLQFPPWGMTAVLKPYISLIFLFLHSVRPCLDLWFRK